jgi:hypothetical protein
MRVAAAVVGESTVSEGLPSRDIAEPGWSVESSSQVPAAAEGKKATAEEESSTGGKVATEGKKVGAEGKSSTGSVLYSEQQQQQREIGPGIPATAVSVWTPLLHFPGALEREYVRFKHQKNLWFEWYNALFSVGYCLALVGRMVWERSVMGTAMYLLYIGFKTTSYIPLLLGKEQWFLR